MSDLEKVRTWIKLFPGYQAISDYRIDLLDQIPFQNSIAPSGLVEIRRSEDILGNVTVENQYNFGIYYAFPKDTKDDIGATLNAEWVMAFQQWVQEQSSSGNAPFFGDEPKKERIQAQNGSIYYTDEDGTAVYMVQLSVKFTKKYEVI